MCAHQQSYIKSLISVFLRPLCKPKNISPTSYSMLRCIIEASYKLATFPVTITTGLYLHEHSLYFRQTALMMLARFNA